LDKEVEPLKFANVEALAYNEQLMGVVMCGDTVQCKVLLISEGTFNFIANAKNKFLSSHCKFSCHFWCNLNDTSGLTWEALIKFAEEILT
jgi:hypothetical protein